MLQTFEQVIFESSLQPVFAAIAMAGQTQWSNVVSKSYRITAALIRIGGLRLEL